MELIVTTAPISIEELKKYFVNKDTKYIIDYKNSKLQGMKLLTYLSNLDIPCDVKVDSDSEDFYSLLKDYFNNPFLVSIETLEVAAIRVLLTDKGIVEDSSLTKFIEDNREIINKWTSVLESLTLYNMYIVQQPALTEFVKSHDLIQGTDLVGINFVNLLKYEEFYDFYEILNKNNLKYYQNYFDDYLFKGKNLYNYWANENNPLFCLMYGIITDVDLSVIGQIDFKELSKV